MRFQYTSNSNSPKEMHISAQIPTPEDLFQRQAVETPLQKLHPKRRCATQLLRCRDPGTIGLSINQSQTTREKKNHFPHRYEK
jgi:hypothetical protein